MLNLIRALLILGATAWLGGCATVSHDLNLMGYTKPVYAPTYSHPTNIGTSQPAPSN